MLFFIAFNLVVISVNHCAFVRLLILRYYLRLCKRNKFKRKLRKLKPIKVLLEEAADEQQNVEANDSIQNSESQFLPEQQVAVNAIELDG